MADVGEVLECAVEVCRYNEELECHAGSIRVGSDHAVCGTFSAAETRVEVSEEVATVGSCAMDNCTYNENSRCYATPGINVDDHMEHADCETYTPETM